ncbi:carboxylesterase/lipase family protein [Amycolatopsis nivea]
MTSSSPVAEFADRRAVVETRFGTLQGVFEEGNYVYRGVPFAAPPVGELRFRPPAPVPSWPGVRDATRSGPASAQINSSNADRVRQLIAELDPGVPGIVSWPPYTPATYDQPNASEDCLYLDIWVPADVEETMPVYLYFHGGANAVSSGSFHLERGANLAREAQVVVVRPNYRMGALGWVHFGLLGDSLGEAVNLGLQDQVAALRWVHDNIAAFGGDPERITAAGESAGATAVSHLLTNPDTRPLIRRAVLQSLSPFNNWCTQWLPEAEQVARLYLDLLGIDDPGALATVDVERLLAVQNIMTRYVPADANVAWRPLGAVVDGAWVHEQPASYLSTPQPDLDRIGAEKSLEVIVGFARDEWQFFRGHSPTARHGTEQAVHAVAEQVFGDRAGGVLEEFRTLRPPGTVPGVTLSDLMSFEFFAMSSLAIAANLARAGIPVWVFQFSWDLPGLRGELRAVHTGDTPFLFRNYSEADLACWPAFEGIDRARLGRISREMGEHYRRFIHHGEPGEDWARFDESTGNVLWFGEDIRMCPGLLRRQQAAVAAAGIDSVEALDRILVANLRRQLGEAEQYRKDDRARRRMD